MSIQEAIKAATFNKNSNTGTPVTTPTVTPDTARANLNVSNISERASETVTKVEDRVGKVGANIAAGVVAGGNELVAGATTMYGAVTGNQEVIDEAEARRNQVKSTLDTFRGKDPNDPSIVDDVAFGIAKYVGIPAGAAGTVAKVAPKIAAAAAAGTVGAISYQETKQDLMNEGVDRETANKAGIGMGLGMGAAAVIPIVPFGIKSAALAASTTGTVAKATTGVVAGAAVGTGVISASQYSVGEYVGSRNELTQYQKAAKMYKDMATNPTNIMLGMTLGVGIGGIVARSGIKAYQADINLIQQLKNDPNKMLTPELMQEIDVVTSKLNAGERLDDLATPLWESIGMSKEDLYLVSAAASKRPVDPNVPDDHLNVEAEYKASLALAIRKAKASNLDYDDLKGEGILSDSDRNLIYRNERILIEYNKTGDESLLDQLEIPQVHRDIYLLEDEYALGGVPGKEMIRESYFNLDRVRTNREEGNPYVPTHLPNINKSNNTRSTVVNVADTIAKGEGTYTSLNRGKAGDAPGAKLPPNITIGQIQELQKLPKGHPDRLFAVGKYQVIPSTLEAAVKALNLSPTTKFTPEIQERIMRQYLLRGKKRGIYSFITKENVTPQDLENALMQSAMEFASVGVPRAINGKAKGQSYYAGTGNNKASISPQTMEAALIAQRKRYQELVAKGEDPELAWELSFSGTRSNEVSTVVKRDIRATKATNEQGEVFVQDWARDALVIPKPKSTLDTIKGFLLGDNRFNVYRNSLDESLAKGFNDVAAESRAIQKVYEEISYKYALDMRNKAAEIGITGKELDNVAINAFNKHQDNLKIGQSKLFNEEYTNLSETNIRAKGNLSEDELIKTAISNVNTRMTQAYVFKAVMPAKQQTKEQQNILDDGTVYAGNKVVESDSYVVRYTDKDGNTKFKTVKRTKQEDNITATKIDEESGIPINRVTDNQGNPLLSIRLPNGRTVYINSQGDRTNFAAVASTSVDPLLARVKALDPNDTITLDGKVYTRDEAIALVNSTKNIDNTALEAFALCALS